jgi:FlaA1/EpsC-like NDP-sugar epimerase
VSPLLEDSLLRFRRVLIVATHGILFMASLTAAFLLRVDFTISPELKPLLVQGLPIFIGLKLLVFGLLRQYSGWWRYVSVDDLLSILRATVIGAVVCAGAVLLFGLRGFPRSIFVLDAIITLLLLAGLRVSVRLFRERWGNRGLPADSAPRVRTLIVGTGPSAEALIREALRNPALGMLAVGLLAEDPRHTGTRLAGLLIVGTPEDIPRLVRDREVRQIVIALEEGYGDLVRRVVAQCTSADVKHRVVPPAEAIVSGRIEINTIRDVDLTDLLGRPPVRLETELVASLLNGDTVAVTGAGGSIGAELCRQVARFGADHILLIEQAENPLFHLERELVQTHPEIRLEPIVADIYDSERLHALFAHHKPRIVLHAAAHKHVPLMEMNPSEAIKNNIVGTLHVIQAAQACRAERCILISTDKAVNPTSVMGASKRMAEMLVQSRVHATDTTTRLAAVRFGNVLGSNGSVIPIFRQQIAAGGPVTVTHPEMRRYFMTIPEATQLVLQAAAFADSGEVFVLDMGEPVCIVDIARDLIRLSGLDPDRDIPIRFTGIRPGEKLFEELSTDSETLEPTDHGRIHRAHLVAPNAETVLDAVERLHRAACEGLPPADMRKYLFACLHALETGAPLDEIVTDRPRLIQLPRG